MSTNHKNNAKENNTDKTQKSEQAKKYSQRANEYREQGKIADAIAEYTKAIELEPENPEFFFERGSSYIEAKELEKGLKDFSSVRKIDPKSEYSKILDDVYQSMQIESVKRLTKEINQNPSNASHYKERGDSYKFLEKYDEAIADYEKALELKIEDNDIYFDLGNCYYEKGDFEQAYNNFEKDFELGGYFEIDDDYARKLERIADYFEYKENYEKAIKILEEIHERNYAYSHGMLIQDQIRHIERITARMDERNKIIADLSHSIKNLIGTIIDPLENLKQETEIKPQVIENALKGANLIREIVNGINLSFKGTIDDFYYDARNNSSSESVDLATIIFESLKYSINNMFDGKYFSNFVRQYFPTKEVFLQAKSDWSKLSSSQTISNDFMGFLNGYFFKININLNDADQFIFGNEKGSALKMLILFQEIILNAAKYSAYVNRSERQLTIGVNHDKKNISINVENTFKENIKAKTTGIGHIILENFANLLHTKPVITTKNNIYSVEIKFANFWETRSK